MALFLRFGTRMMQKCEYVHEGEKIEKTGAIMPSDFARSESEES